ncbi:MAG: hypothetical protein ABF483_08105 [Liquorilactobacillus nagelii]|uniref:hypothetical protein n=1 Tax=Liquorilactobacillus nagelii TaxID=82688 RepID=UPI0012EDE5F2|nr:hypothetical protein [Liquorilactobacillus nagelii]MCI1633933.1 hypothetical protein [Liquorilactobacillus nagelii]MCI1700806.1 hypothetical protein [Liquorilactobacillus nagelii]MCP9315080.1 hypothetical protein [Liquorilactobacillus nagelii]QYH55158.1 hypothetical protein G6O73_11105 [Liquorilactobacillus nagelii DSM 13675]ULQ49114.1 hypothetical protein J6864_09125 [Liquorilactobacillus nagelii]
MLSFITKKWWLMAIGLIIIGSLLILLAGAMVNFNWGHLLNNSGNDWYILFMKN